MIVTRHFKTFNFVNLKLRKVIVKFKNYSTKWLFVFEYKNVSYLLIFPLVSNPQNLILTNSRMFGIRKIVFYSHSLNEDVKYTYNMLIFCILCKKYLKLNKSFSIFFYCTWYCFVVLIFAFSNLDIGIRIRKNDLCLLGSH